MQEILRHQFDRLSDEQLKAISIDESFEDRIDAILCCRNGGKFSDGVFNEMTPNEIKKMLDYLIELRVEYKNLLKDVKDLKHFKDISIGLWVTDKEPINKEMFFQLS